MWAQLSFPFSVQVNNLGQRDLPVTVNFWVPVGLNGIATWAEMEVSHPQVVVLNNCAQLLH